MKKYFIRLDVQKPTDTDYIQVIKQDTLANTLYITLLNAGELIPMSEFTFVEVVADKPDATQWISSGEVLSNGQIKVDLEYQAISAVGVVDISVKLYTGEVVMTTYPFQLRVIADPNAGTDGSVESASEYPILSAMAANETGRLAAESARVVAEGLRVDAETTRDTAEGLRDTAEIARAGAESSRALAESGRVDAEALRVIAEGLRDDAETLRESAEDTRQSQEGTRQTQETARQGAEGLRVTAEEARAGAETSRVNAESARVIAEGLREDAETARVSAEGLRVDAESARVIAEQGRDAAYQGAEDARDALYSTAEGNRDDLYSTAEGSRDTSYNAAEAARDTAYGSAEAARDGLYSTAESDRDSLYATAEAARDVKMGTLANLTTTEKGSIVGAVNEVVSDLTTHKEDYVQEVGEINAQLAEKVPKDIELNDTHNLQSLPNGAKDIYEFEQSRVKKIIKSYVLQSADIGSYTPGTNKAFVTISKSKFVDAITWSNSPKGDTSNDKTSIEVSPNFWDTTDGLLTFGHGGSAFYFFFPKTMFANLTEARTALTGAKINYQAVTPEYVSLPQTLSANTKELLRLSENLSEVEPNVANSVYRTKLSVRPSLVRTRKAIMTISYDDYSTSIYDYAFPVHKAENTPATFFVVPKNIDDGVVNGSWGNAETWERLKEMHFYPGKGRIEVGHHSYDHIIYDGKSVDWLVEDIEKGLSCFARNGINVDKFAYPGGARTNTSDYVIQKYFTLGRVVVEALNDFDTHPYRINSYRMDASHHTMAELKGYIDLAAAQGKWIDFYAHGIHPTGTIVSAVRTPSELTELIQYAKSKGISMVSYDDALDIFGALDFYMNIDGTIRKHIKRG